MECASHRLSLATWRLRTFRQLVATSHQPHIARRSISTSPRHEAPETKADTETNIPPSQRLPQSPLVTNMRTGPEKQHKRLPNKADLEPLSKNPWAVALASPPRMCILTGARIPRDILGQWGLVKKPNADLNYMLPVGLLQDSLARKSTPVQTSDPDKATGETESSITPVRNEKLGRTLFLRMVDRLSFLRIITPIFVRSAGKKPAITKMVPYRWKHPHGPITAKEEKNMTWMKDMPEYVLMHMRRDVARKLDAAREKWGLGGEDGVWSALDVQEISDAGIVDALGRLGSIERAECGAVILHPRGEVESGSLDEVVHPQTQKKIPVFDLSKLLGESDLERLRQTEAAHYQQVALFFRPEDPSSIKAMLSLWKLKQFLVEDPALNM
ncbi:hypothetical protein N7476_011405 [Penicillium atrosanguineum]|uniref:Uncharacterized protein n=1 Tax=Penicillium atrosanguineum TaxID=1132637 RepID=A0A9W9PNY2_9EURO|nr:hypothetical protein N7526_010689 [Penicillium atrosanguineum]KAJ5299848.1 hypothetical protein N7476_011405 [Penicillium atrosanguineum]